MEQEGPGYHIGAVARMTRLDEHTIRAWERRHQAVSPRRSAGGTRIYADDDVARLRLLKALTDCGDPIGQIATLDDEQLRERLSKHGAWRGSLDPTPSPSRAIRVAAVGRSWAGAREASPPIGGLTFVTTASSTEDFLASPVDGTPDVLLCDLTVLGPDPATEAQRLLAHSGAPIGIVIYEFARQADLSALVAQGLQLVRGPLRLAQLRRVIQWMVPTAGAGSPERREAPPTGDEAPIESIERRFSDEQLSRLREITSSVDCECPNHLSGIIGSLVEFERYAKRCESQSPADASLHRRLSDGTGRARRSMEELLLAVCEHDGIDIT